MKRVLVQSDLVSVLLSDNYFLLNIYIKHSQTLVYIYIKILQIQCEYIIQ